jgi:hypothetical protein
MFQSEHGVAVRTFFVPLARQSTHGDVQNPTRRNTPVFWENDMLVEPTLPPKVVEV